jgi:hypothetical protein
MTVDFINSETVKIDGKNLIYLRDYRALLDETAKIFTWMIGFAPRWKK